MSGQKWFSVRNRPQCTVTLCECVLVLTDLAHEIGAPALWGQLLDASAIRPNRPGMRETAGAGSNHENYVMDVI